MCERWSLKFRGNNVVRRKFWCVEHDTLAAKIACITWNEAISEFLQCNCKTDNSIKCITSRPNVLCMINTGLLLTDVNAIYLYIWFTFIWFLFSGCHYQNVDHCPSNTEAQLQDLLSKPQQRQCLLWNPRFWYSSWQEVESLGFRGKEL